MTKLVTSYTAPNIVNGLTDDENTVLRDLWRQWTTHRAKNLLLSVYYDGHRAFQDLGIAVPPQMTQTRAALGWPAKAVTALARKHVFEGYALDGKSDVYGTDTTLAANGFDVELSQAITSAYKHSCAFLTVTAGDPTRQDPDVVIQARDAEMSAALWDKRRRELSAFLIIDSTDDHGQPDGAVLYLHHETYRLTRTTGAWDAIPLGNRTGRLLVEPLVYDPQLNRPFGRSRITREVRYLTDAAIRTLVRTETNAEFFASPQRYALGVDSGAFDHDDRWSAIMGRLWALEPNEDGNTPTVGQFAQASMEPHLAMYRQLAQNFCAATNLPQSSVGLFAENPTSAEAMQTAEAALADEAEWQWRIFTPALTRTLQNIIMVRDSLTTTPDDLWRVKPKWTPARYASPSASADYIAKVVATFPQLSTSTVALRRAGLTVEDLEEIQAEQRTAGASTLLDKALAAVDAKNTATTNTATVTP